MKHGQHFAWTAIWVGLTARLRNSKHVLPGIDKLRADYWETIKKPWGNHGEAMGKQGIHFAMELRATPRRKDPAEWDFVSCLLETPRGNEPFSRRFPQIKSKTKGRGWWSFMAPRRHYDASALNKSTLKQKMAHPSWRMPILIRQIILARFIPPPVAVLVGFPMTSMVCTGLVSPTPTRFAPVCQTLGNGLLPWPGLALPNLSAAPELSESSLYSTASTLTRESFF